MLPVHLIQRQSYYGQVSAFHVSGKFIARIESRVHLGVSCVAGITAVRKWEDLACSNCATSFLLLMLRSRGKQLRSCSSATELLPIR
jgi:hypothetical protein